MLDNERYLVEKAKSGDKKAFDAMFDGCGKKVYNIALRMMGNSEDALEISQEVFIKIFKSLKSFKGDASFSTWVYRITVNVCLDEIRKRKK